MKGQSKLRSFLIFLSLTAGIFLIVWFALPRILSVDYGAEGLVKGASEEEEKPKEEEKPVALHVERPEMMKALYMTACVAGVPSWRESLAKLIDDTELNSIIIDIKDYTGMISYDLKGPEFVPNSNCFVRDMKEFVESLHKRGIYIIGRVTVFQDSTYTKSHPDLAVKKKDGTTWRDRKGLAFVDVGATPYWEHMVTLAETAYADGFDEINFDYIRYPSDGNMTDIWFSQSPASTTKVANLERFFKYLRENIPQGKPIISGDLFGMTTTNNDDLNIGQKLEVALKYFDYVYPMVYPSHYPATWNGFAKPAERPGEVVKVAMQGAVDKANAAGISPDKLCTWIQDFDLGATYTPAMVRAQIQSTYDVGLKCWLLWDASNKYTPSALLPG
ncbi:MAG TPA: putative glycoside hydrolase [Candidatus Paceibacterota bacterium]|nr:putative glycoside hydrolase [Candidatus Paceibacterota bacterium]